MKYTGNGIYWIGCGEDPPRANNSKICRWDVDVIGRKHHDSFLGLHSFPVKTNRESLHPVEGLSG